MLRSRTLSRAALVLALGLALCAKPAAAQVDGEGFTPGAGCPAGSVTGHANTASWDTIFECNGSSQWQRGPYFFGSPSDACDSNHAGMVQWTGSAFAQNRFEFCNGSWISVGAAATLRFPGSQRRRAARPSTAERMRRYGSGARSPADGDDAHDILDDGRNAVEPARHRGRCDLDRLCAERDRCHHRQRI